MTAEITNFHRAAWAKNALATFVAETWTDTTVNRLVPDDLTIAISDLIADLLHLALLKHLDTEHILARARTHFDDEIAEEA